MTLTTGTDRPPLHVLLVAPTFGAIGGIEAFVLAVAESLRDDQRFTLQICFKQTDACELQPEFVEICRGFPVEFCKRASRQLWSAIAWADVVHGQNASPDVAVIAAVHRRPLVLTIHNILPAGPPLRRLASRLAIRVAQERWYNSRFVWNTWEPQGPHAASACIPTTSHLQRAWVDPAGRRGFAFLGRLVTGKGADILIDAYVQAKLDPDEWPLTIIGDGPMKAQLEARCVRDELAGIRFTGLVTGDAKAQLIAGAKWLVAPSHWQEPFGLVALEARSVGVPCIITADGGLPEAAGRDALVCEPASAVALAGLLQEAAGMPASAYAERSRRTRADLEQELASASFYPDAYLRVTRRAIAL